MALYRDQGLVLRTHKLGEADRIITIFFRQRGITRVVAKGVRRTSSKFGARLEPFMLVDVQCYEGRSLDTVTQAETLAAYAGPISTDYDLYEIANIIVETADKLCQDDGGLAQYRLLIGAIRTLSEKSHDAQLVRDSYLLRAISLAGWEATFNVCAQCGSPQTPVALAVALGGAVCQECNVAGGMRVLSETLSLLEALKRGDWDLAHSIEGRARDEAAAFISAYTQWHLERGLRSVAVANSYTR